MDKPVEQMTDRYTGFCVFPTGGGCCGDPEMPKSDFCEEHNELKEFGRCYFCRDYHEHENCIGVPCQCPCPPPNQIMKEKRREEILAKLTPSERAELGF